MDRQVELELEPKVFVFTALALLVAAAVLFRRCKAGSVASCPTAASASSAATCADDGPPSRRLSQNLKQIQQQNQKLSKSLQKLPLQQKTASLNQFVAQNLFQNQNVFSKQPAAAAAADDDDKVTFTPGKKASKFETLMTKEEMEEEQRVQQEQLAAIFMLLRENAEALGEVTEGDMEEQLKLYSL
ncbi:matrix-remodeling-associated protein 7-like [Syngnathus scovelli]|uniref:matrix-remodeling-associated protein 7-like n=1 Tax=Syngnathus scovelli TaxID=161590 RepID=UPI0035C9F6AB